jgi:hypothetical protein
MEKMPHIDPELLGDQIQLFYDEYPYVDTITALLFGFDRGLRRLEEMAEADFHEETGAFEAFGRRAEAFDARVQWYVDALAGGDGPNEKLELVAPPLFEGEFDEGFQPQPEHADVQTLWRLANEYHSLKTADHEHLDYTLEDAQDFVVAFWLDVRQHLIGEISGTEDVDAEIEEAATRAESLGEDAGEVVSMGAPSQGPERSSMAPLLLGIGAILWMAKRK